MIKIKDRKVKIFLILFIAYSKRVYINFYMSRSTSKTKITHLKVRIFYDRKFSKLY